MTEYARALPFETRNFMRVVAERDRPHFQGAPQNPTQQARREALIANRVLIRPRLKDGREVFDVLKLYGGRVEEPYVKDCPFWEEALQLSLMCMAGRTTVSLAGARSLLRGAQGGMLMPEKGLSKPLAEVGLNPSEMVELGMVRKLGGDYEVMPPADPSKRKPPEIVDQYGKKV